MIIVDCPRCEGKSKHERGTFIRKCCDRCLNSGQVSLMSREILIHDVKQVHELQEKYIDEDRLHIVRAEAERLIALLDCIFEYEEREKNDKLRERGVVG